MTNLDDFLDQVLSETADGPLCPCSHRRDFHRHEPDGKHCIRACGCRRFRGAEEKSAATEKPCHLPCDPDCEIGPVHCWNWHRPKHKPDWHNPARCDASATRETSG